MDSAPKYSIVETKQFTQKANQLHGLGINVDQLLWDMNLAFERDPTIGLPVGSNNRYWLLFRGTAAITTVILEYRIDRPQIILLDCIWS